MTPLLGERHHSDPDVNVGADCTLNGLRPKRP